jgi:hypothetical protein
VNRSTLAAGIAIISQLACASPRPPVRVHTTVQAPVDPPAAPASRFVVVDHEGKVITAPTSRRSTSIVQLQARGMGDAVLWTLPCDSIQAFGTTGTGAVVVVAVREKEEELLWVDATGDIVWTKPISTSYAAVGGPVSASGEMAVALFSDTNEILQVGPRGHVTSTLSLETKFHRKVGLSTSGIVYSADHDGSVLFLHPDGRPVWTGSRFTPSGDISNWPNRQPRIVVHPNGAVTFLTEDRRIVTHGPDGKRAWALGMRGNPQQAWTLNDGDLLVATRDCSVTRVGAGGKVKWSEPVTAHASPRCYWNETYVKEDSTGLLFVRVAPNAAPLWVRVLDADGTLRWKTNAPHRTWSAYLEPQSPDRAALVEQLNERETIERPPTPLDEDLPGEVREAVFTRQLPDRIDSGIAKSDGEAYALSGERLWTWDGQTWKGGKKLRPSLRTLRRGAVHLVGFEPERLVLGAKGEPWIVGMRSTEGDQIRRYVASLLRRKGGAWREDVEVANAFFDDVMENLYFSSARVIRAGERAACCAHLTCMTLDGNRWQRSDHDDGDDIRLLLDKGGSSFTAHDLWGTTPDLWSVGERLEHHDGKQWVPQVSLVGEPSGVWGAAPNDVWLTGKNGIAHWDGTRWRRVAGVHGEVLGVFGSGKRVWFAAADGLWSFDRWVGPPVRVPKLAPPDATAHEDVPTTVVGRCKDSYLVSKKTYSIDGGGELSAATAVGVARDGAAWFADGSRVVQVQDGKARLISQEASLVGFGRIAPASSDRGWVIAERGIAAIDGTTTAFATARLPELQAVSVDERGEVWAVSASNDDGLPHIIRANGRQSEYVHDVPAAAYVSASTWSGGEVWFAGGLHATRNGPATWPAGEGIIVHRRPAGSVWHRIPAGPLLAIAAVGNGRAWGVGPAGMVVRVEGGKVTVERLDTARWLRGVAGSGPRDTWLVGDDDTLIHWNGESMCQMAKLPLPARAQLVSVASRGANKAWVVGPDGILEVEAR